MDSEPICHTTVEIFEWNGTGESTTPRAADGFSAQGIYAEVRGGSSSSAGRLLDVSSRVADSASGCRNQR